MKFRNNFGWFVVIKSKPFAFNSISFLSFLEELQQADIRPDFFMISATSGFICSLSSRSIPSILLALAI